MTPLDFIASLEHGEAKAAALTVYNLMTPVWIEITDDPATLPPNGVWIEAKDEQRRFLAMWGNSNDPLIKKWKSKDFEDLKYGRRNTMTPTHWRPIA
jgi:hypothetical protein